MTARDIHTTPAVAPPRFEPLVTSRLTLRPFDPGDAEQLLAYYGNPEVTRFLLHEPWDAREAAEQARTRSLQTSLTAGGGALAVAVELDGSLVGDVSLWTTDDAGQRAEAGWVFHPDHAGRGYASEAVEALFAFALGDGVLRRIGARMDARNTGSARLCERLGMTREGHLRQDFWSKEEWVDTLVFGLLATDPAAQALARRHHPPRLEV